MPDTSRKHTFKMAHHPSTVRKVCSYGVDTIHGLSHDHTTTALSQGAHQSYKKEPRALKKFHGNRLPRTPVHHKTLQRDCKKRNSQGTTGTSKSTSQLGIKHQCTRTWTKYTKVQGCASTCWLLTHCCDNAADD